MRQGCSSSPPLFNLYSEEAINEIKETNYNMKINIEKTKAVACKTKSGKKRLNIKIDNEKIEEISEFFYLGSKITRGVRCNSDISSRIGQAKKVFAKIP